MNQICKNCVMDTSDSKIIFDKNGVCDHCNTFYKSIEPKWHTEERGEKKLFQLVEIIKTIDIEIIQDVKVFDVYEGENVPPNKKSIALNVTLQAMNRTLDENDLDQLNKKIISTVQDKTGASIRS